MGLSSGAVNGVRDFDLASLRAGGATWLMNVTESPDLVRRRGRWITNKVMEIYVQEVSAMMYLPRLEQGQHENIFAWANSFQAAFQFAKWSVDLHLSPSLSISCCSTDLQCLSRREIFPMLESLGWKAAAVVQLQLRCSLVTSTSRCKRDPASPCAVRMSVDPRAASSFTPGPTRARPQQLYSCSFAAHL